MILSFQIEKSRNVDPYQTAVWSGSTLFATLSQDKIDVDVW